MPTFDFVHARIVLVALVLSSCTTAPVSVDAYQGCDVAPNIWQQVSDPPEREALLDLLDKASKARIRDHFVATSEQREVWFEDSSHNFLACLFNPLKSCYGGELRKVKFNKVGTSWEADPIVQLKCID